MAVAPVNSAQIIALNAGTSKPLPGVAGGPVMSWKCTLETAVGDTASIYRLFRVPWNIIIEGLWYACDAITTLTIDIGVYDIPTVNSGAVIDADEFASAAAATSALSVWTDVLFEAVPADIVKAEQPLWQRIGTTELLARGKNYDICATAVGAPGAVGTLSFKMHATST